MVIAIKSIGVLFILVGILYLVKPEVFKRLMEFFKKGKRMYFAGLIRFILAVVFLLGASDCYIKWVIAAFGILFLISGLLVFMLGPKKARSSNRLVPKAAGPDSSPYRCNRPGLWSDYYLFRIT